MEDRLPRKRRVRVGGLAAAPDDGRSAFGANGLRFNPSETAMFVANTGDDTVIEIPASRPPPSGPVLAPGPRRCSRTR